MADVASCCTVRAAKPVVLIVASANSSGQVLRAICFIRSECCVLRLYFYFLISGENIECTAVYCLWPVLLLPGCVIGSKASLCCSTMFRQLSGIHFTSLSVIPLARLARRHSILQCTVYRSHRFESKIGLMKSLLHVAMPGRVVVKVYFNVSPTLDLLALVVGFVSLLRSCTRRSRMTCR